MENTSNFPMFSQLNRLSVGAKMIIGFMALLALLLAVGGGHPLLSGESGYNRCFSGERTGSRHAPGVGRAE